MFFRHLERLLDGGGTPEELARRLAPRREETPPAFPGGTRVTEKALGRRWKPFE